MEQCRRRKQHTGEKIHKNEMRSIADAVLVRDVPKREQVEALIAWFTGANAIRIRTNQ